MGHFPVINVPKLKITQEIDCSTETSSTLTKIKAQIDQNKSTSCWISVFFFFLQKSGKGNQNKGNQNKGGGGGGGNKSGGGGGGKKGYHFNVCFMNDVSLKILCIFPGGKKWYALISGSDFAGNSVLYK